MLHKSLIHRFSTVHLYNSGVFPFSACSVLLAGDDTGSVWLYDADPQVLAGKLKDKQHKQAQVTKLTRHS